MVAAVTVIQETDLMVDLAVVLLVDFLDQVVAEDHGNDGGGANGSPLGGDNYRGGGGGGAGGGLAIVVHLQALVVMVQHLHNRHLCNKSRRRWRRWR